MRSLESLVSTPHGHKLSPATDSRVTVMVVNLFFSNISLLPVQGFGYLIPRSISQRSNPDSALGVVFDSESTNGQDSALGTKLTVMFGGHWWNNLADLPDERQGAQMAQSLLQRHLGVTDIPKATKVTLQKECIPQYTVGHCERMWNTHHELKRISGGRFRVAGSNYGGVSVNDCVRSAYETARGILAEDEGTGLERFDPDSRYQLVSTREGQGRP